MGKMNLNEALSKVTGDCPIDDKAVKDLLLLAKGKCAERVGSRINGNIECGEAENPENDSETSLSDCLDNSMDCSMISEKVKNILVYRVITIETLRNIQKLYKFQSITGAIDFVEQEIKKILFPHFGSPQWLDWVPLHTNRITFKELDRIAENSFERGYFNGFSDRERLSAKISFYSRLKKEEKIK